MLLVILLSTSVWSLSGKTGLNLNQNYYNQDWQGSEECS